MQAPRLVWMAGICGACAIALTGSERSASRQQNSARIVVTYWEKWNGDEMEAMRRVVDAFNRSQNRITVKYLSISNVADKTLLATSGGNPPDVAGLWSDQVVQFADADALLDLSDLAARGGIRSDQYVSSYWNELIYKNHLYALPTTPGCSALYVNEDLIPPRWRSRNSFPKTLGEFDKLVNTVSVKDPSKGVVRAGFLPRDGFGSGSWPYLFGGSFERNGNVWVNGPESIEAWKWVHSFAERFGVRETQTFRSGFGNYSSPDNPFMSGKLAVYLDGPWFGNYIRLFNPKIHWFAAPIPYPDGHPELKDFTVLNLNTLMIPKGSKHPQEAFEFVKFVQRQDMMDQLCIDQQCNSPLSRVSEHFFKVHPNKDIRLFDRLARSSRGMAPPKMGIWSQIGREVGNSVDQLDLGEMSPKAAMDQAQGRLDVAWTKYKAQVLTH